MRSKPILKMWQDGFSSSDEELPKTSPNNQTAKKSPDLPYDLERQRRTTELAETVLEELMAMTHEDVREIQERMEEVSTESIEALVARNQVLAASVAEAQRLHFVASGPQSRSPLPHPIHQSSSGVL